MACMRHMRRADLHVHTTASDGSLSPKRVVEIAREVGLNAVGIADHDTVCGLDEALQTGTELGVEVVPCLEISALADDGTEVHILGYFIDHHNPPLVGRLEVLKQARWDRARRMVEQLKAVGVEIGMDRVAEIAGSGAVGRPHVARAICEVGAASSMDAAFGRFLVEGCPGFVPRYKITPSEAVRMVLNSGGAACCGHVAKLKGDELVLELCKVGLAAIEVYHPDHGPAASRFYKNFAEKHGLIATGGSDFHGFGGLKVAEIGSVTVPYEVVEQLKRAAAGQG